MRKLIAISTALAMAAGAAPGLAQTTTEVSESGVDDSAVTRAELDVNQDNDGAETDAADDSYGAAIAAVTGWEDVDLAGITEQSQVTIVPLSTLKGGSEDEAAAFDTALAAHAMAKADVHAAVADNSAIAAKVEAEGFANDDVVAIRSKQDGSVTVYVDDRA
ncbi:hypothetical protein [Devosia sp. RR2S18]|uniref:hypothetical protein n=1 Tax=Devosia rhizosphaerae TaxID=3049774 RepID=UPI002541427E|nr:hypothetical protein [Devosia sp. RR2S18]WIJ25595.1 hypothetical protein QOV41_02125 [Devosia sp. RR2S18]